MRVFTQAFFSLFFVHIQSEPECGDTFSRFQKWRLLGLG